jgi:hypothetical protein
MGTQQPERIQFEICGTITKQVHTQSNSPCDTDTQIRIGPENEVTTICQTGCTDETITTCNTAVISFVSICSEKGWFATFEFSNQQASCADTDKTGTVPIDFQPVEPQQDTALAAGAPDGRSGEPDLEAPNFFCPNKIPIDGCEQHLQSCIPDHCTRKYIGTPQNNLCEQIDTQTPNNQNYPNQCNP